MTDYTRESAARAFADRVADARPNERSYYLPEKYQLGVVADWLDRHGVAYTTEGRVFSHPIDVLATKYDTTVAVELKSRNVGKGIEQAHRNCDYVDFSYLSVWEDDVTDGLRERVAGTPVGLVGVDDRLYFHSPASETSKELCGREAILDTIQSDVRGDYSVQQ